MNSTTSQGSHPRVGIEDLRQLLELAESDFEQLRHARVFITGGTGYIGRWLLEALCYANSTRDLAINVVVLTRNPQKFADLCPHLASDPCVSFVHGDVRDFAGLTGKFTHIIHAATDVIATNSALDTFDVTVAGTRRVLDVARDYGAGAVLLLSSGAVYGRLKQPVDRISEAEPCTSDVTTSSAAYGLGKIATEWLGNAYSQQYGFSCKSARIFAQVGPYLELDAHFAAGNFIRDALRGEKLTIKGDGTSIRSYMYASDLVAWLLAILVRGRAGASYNVGSEEAVSIRDLAETLARTVGLPRNNIVILGQAAPGVAPDRYLPSTERAQAELGLSITVPFEEALCRTVEWYRPQFKTGKRE